MTTAASGYAAAAEALGRLRGQLVAAERGARLNEKLHPTHRRSAVNLAHYLALRSHDIRLLQQDLARLGLSSLGRCEAHVLASVDQVAALLDLLTGTESDRAGSEEVISFDEGLVCLADNTSGALGPAPNGRATRIMVTMPSAAAADASLARDLVQSGMDCARINCAHDGPDAWAAIADHVRKAAADAGRPCRILMDLAGPKLRTGDLPTVPGVIKLRPTRDRRGRVVTPAGAWLVPDEDRLVTPIDEPAIPVPAAWLTELQEGDTVTLRDARQARRGLRVSELSGRAVRVETDRTVYLEEGTTLRTGADDSERRCAVGSLPAVPVPLVVRPGDQVVLTADLEAAARPRPPTAPALVGCTLPDVFNHVGPGDRVWFDDGKIGAVMVAVRPGEADLEITVAAATGTKLRAEKGINLPDTDLHLSAITAEDAAVVPFVAAHADLVGMSFVQRPRDVTRLHRLLAELGAPDVGIVLKIETAKAFARLPELLLAAMAHERVAVMIARGDLAVECGWQRLAEVQEEILWLAEAAHLPVIWATQVLDQLARTGQPSRAEITDAAMSQRAECVMLNKGPHIVEAVAALDDILRRMGAHQHKKAPLLRRLRAWSAKPPD